MSELQSLCRALEASVQPLPGLARGLDQRAVRLRAVAAEVGRVARQVEGGPPVSGVVNALLVAAAAVEASSRSLIGAAQHSRNYVARNTGDGADGAIGGGAGGDGPGDTPTVGPQFSTQVLAGIWGSSFATPAGRAFFAPDEDDIRELAAALKPFAAEYTVDAHGSPTNVSIGETQIGAKELAELIRADVAWKGRPVRLFSCDTGKGPHPIAAEVARELDVEVTAPRNPVWSNAAGQSWVAPYDWKVVGGTLQRVSGPPDAGGWRTFGPGAEHSEAGP